MSCKPFNVYESGVATSEDGPDNSMEEICKRFLLGEQINKHKYEGQVTDCIYRQ